MNNKFNLADIVNDIIAMSDAEIAVLAQALVAYDVEQANALCMALANAK
jgi:hypothetical protein